MHGRKMVGAIGRRRMLRMELPGKRKRGRPKGGLWVRGERTWLRRRQTIGPNGDGQSAVAIPDERSQQKKF